MNEKMQDRVETLINSDFVVGLLFNLHTVRERYSFHVIDEETPALRGKLICTSLDNQ